MVQWKELKNVYEDQITVLENKLFSLTEFDQKKIKVNYSTGNLQTPRSNESNLTLPVYFPNRAET